MSSSSKSQAQGREDVEFSDNDLTPRVRHGMSYLHQALANIAKDDLEQLKELRNAVDERCRALESQMQDVVLADAEPEAHIPQVSFIDDGRVALNGNQKQLGDWDVTMQIGVGQYGKVFSARNRFSSQKEVVKMISKEQVSSPEDWLNACNEHVALRTVGQHPSIAHLTGALQSQDYIYFFNIFVKGKDLFDFLKIRQQNNTPVRPEAIEKTFVSMTSALAHCHGVSICHRDIKPENIIIDQDYTAKLIDFGCACPRFELPQQCAGTLPFIAPEVLCSTARDGAPTDVWSLAVVLMEMIHGLGTLPKALGWDNMEISITERGLQLQNLFAIPAQGLANVRSSIRDTRTFQGDPALVSMLHSVPSQRPTAKQLCEVALLGPN